jgi:hypothetical protein
MRPVVFDCAHGSAHEALIELAPVVVAGSRYLHRGGTPMATVSVRYIVNDVDAAIALYCENLGFTEVMHPQ